MARIRTFKPEMAKSARLSEIPRELLYTWQQLWPQCDDKGRFDGDPRLIWAAIYPLRTDVPVIQLTAELQMLVDYERICCYRGCDAKVWMHTLGWHHQKIDHPSKSLIPPCRVHEQTAECLHHGAEAAQCLSSTARFVEAAPVTTDNLDGPRDASRSLREGKELFIPAGDAPVLIHPHLLGDSRDPREPSRSDLVPRTVDLVPGTEDTTASRSATPTSSTRRGTRIPDDFAVTDAMRVWAHEQGWADPEIDAVTEEFLDYWQALPGARATKLDWVKTWKNRLRDQSRRRPQTARPTTNDKVAGGLDLARRLAGEGR